VKRRLSLLILLSLTGFVGLAGLSYSFFGRHTLRNYLAGLRAKGEKITMSELAASLTPGVIDTALPLSNAVAKLGMPPADPTNSDLMHFVSIGHARVACRQPMPPWSSANLGGADNWTELNNRVARMAGPLSELRLMLKQPAPNAGPRTNIFLQTGARYPIIKTGACWLACAALADLHEGGRGEALANIQALADMANLYREEFTLYDQMIRVAVAQLGLDLTWEALNSAQWDTEQLLSLQKSWESVDLLSGLERGLEGERIFGSESLNWWLAEKEQSQSASLPWDALCRHLIKRLWLETVVANDLRFGIRYWQGKVELVRDFKHNRPLKEILVPWQSLDKQLERKTHVPLRFFYLISLVSVKNPKPALLRILHVETERRLVVTVIALERCRRQHGCYPKSLDALVPEFLSSSIPDCMNGHPFGYQNYANGTFKLYSVGEDGIDNGGDPEPASPGGKIGLWEGRDAVWPLPLL
jgi:hypothetical protein